MSYSPSRAATANQGRRQSFAELKEEARGKWAYIFEDLAPELAEALASKGKHVPCPVHGGKDGFRLFREYPERGNGICNTCGAQTNGFAMLAWVRGYDYRDAVREVAHWLRGESTAPTIAKRPPPQIAPPPDRSKALASIRRIWTETLPIKGTVAERYLAKRGIYSRNVPPTLRFHPELPYWDPEARKVIGRFPSMVAAVKNPMGKIVALHRTFLTDKATKADVPEPRKMTMLAAAVQGAAIKLYPSTDVLDLGEGIETMLAVRVATHGPVWAATSASLLELIEIPGTVRHVRIWADKDTPAPKKAKQAGQQDEGSPIGRGEQAAEKLAARLRAQGITVDILLPRHPIPEGAKGIDWLDVLQRFGVGEFPVGRRQVRSAA